MNSFYKQRALKTVFMVFFMLILTIPVLSTDIPAPIIESFKKGNTNMLSGYLNSQVECVVLQNENIYTNKQAELILKDFFSKHVPNDFTIIHKSDKGYAIGKLKTNKGEYRVTILLKTTAGKELIHQLRIEIENNE